MNVKDMRFELKIDGLRPGELRGRASVYGNVDSYNDVVMPGAFTKSLKERPILPVLKQHMPSESIGLAQFEDRADGLWMTGRLLIDDLQVAREEWVRAKNGLVSGISIGYESVREDFTGGVRQLKEIALYEVSLVTFPANREARVTDVKAAANAVAALKSMAEELRRLNDELRGDAPAAAEIRQIFADAQSAVRRHR